MKRLDGGRFCQGEREVAYENSGKYGEEETSDSIG